MSCIGDVFSEYIYTGQFYTLAEDAADAMFAALGLSQVAFVESCVVCDGPILGIWRGLQYCCNPCAIQVEHVGRAGR